MRRVLIETRRRAVASVQRRARLVHSVPSCDAPPDETGAHCQKRQELSLSLSFQSFFFQERQLTSITGYGIVYYDRMGHCPRWTRQICFESGAASPARRLQILRRRVHLGHVPQRGGGGVVMRVISAKKMQKNALKKCVIEHHRTFGFRRVIDPQPLPYKPKILLLTYSNELCT